MTSMKRVDNRSILRHGARLVVLLCALSPLQAIAQADSEKIDDLLSRLPQSQDAAQAGRIQAELAIEWAKSGSSAVDLLFQRGTDAVSKGDFTTAVEHLTAAIDHDPEFLSAYMVRANAYIQAGDIGPALADLGVILDHEPRHFGAVAAVAVILEETSKKPQALAAFRRAAQLHPFIPDVNDAITRLEKELEGQEL